MLWPHRHLPKNVHVYLNSCLFGTNIQCKENPHPLLTRVENFIN